MKNIRMKKAIALCISAATLMVVIAGCSSKTSNADSESIDSVSVSDVSVNTTEKESPMLAEKVKAGTLPALNDRLPETPKLLNELASEHLTLEEGQYGGTLRAATTTITDYGAFLVSMFEPLVNSPSFKGEEFVPNVAESYDVSDDAATYTFTLRKGMKWSDGEPLTTSDVDFAINDVMSNPEITPTFPNIYRTNGSAQGNPMKLEVIDDYTYKLIFDQPYEGFLVKLALQGWPSYYDLLKPAHYLKKYHKEYADSTEFAKLLSENNYTDEQWGTLFNDYDITNWEMANPKALGFPFLTPWIPVNFETSKISLERNPYYFKVDEQGRQMPYIDKGEIYYVSDAEVLNNMIISGQVDFANGEMAKMQLYKENEANGGYTTKVANYHGRLGNIYFNHNYEDADWQTAINDIRFRQALSLSVNREQILDTVFYGLGTLPDNVGYSEFDQVKANKLLDEMGLDKKNSDGIRLYPSGKTVDILFEISNRVPENLPIAEMVAPMLKEVGINATFKSIDVALFNERKAANQVQAFVERMETYWWMGDAKFSYWAPMWDSWYQSGGTKGTEPPADVITLMDYARDVTAKNIEYEAPAAYESLCKGVKQQYRYVPIMDFSQMPLIINKNLGNTDFTGDLTTIILNFSLEEMYFKD